MGKTAIIYASMSGNTEAIADLIEKGLKEAGSEAKKFEAMDIDGTVFTEYDHFLIGAYTWGDGEMPDEMLDLYDEMDDYDFEDKTIALFGSGDTAYDLFCGAVDLIAEKIQQNSGSLIMESLKIECFPDGDQEEACLEFGRQFTRCIQSAVRS
ncbi:flavodoxin [Peribacillus frigoritolerans]|uniref:flavodoxin n=1 Tax=Peribacillus frigoritolerans TaxID=450367 RepID=UPI00105968F1|nr:flavodoxin [Peribacillus frigoritolerans]TDL80118.1 flavodoxin [Peribacillus frigoritolerans]